ncbi:hypothetical protein [Burkholderia pseudomallei]
MVVQENGRASHGSGSRDARAGVVPAWLSLSPFALRHVASRYWLRPAWCRYGSMPRLSQAAHTPRP